MADLVLPVDVRVTGLTCCVEVPPSVLCQEAVRCHKEAMCSMSFVQAGVTVLLAMSAMLMSQHYILTCIFNRLNEVPLNRNTQQRSHGDLWVEMWPRSSGT